MCFTSCRSVYLSCLFISKKFDRIDKPDFFKQRAADGLSIRFFLNQRASDLAVAIHLTEDLKGINLNKKKIKLVYAMYMGY